MNKSELNIKATASLEEEIQEELNSPDPSVETAKAILRGTNDRSRTSEDDTEDS